MKYSIHWLLSYGSEWTNWLILRWSKGNISYTPDNNFMKHHMHHLTMVMHIQYKFHDILSNGWGWKIHWRLGNQKEITPKLLMTFWWTFTCITIPWSYIFSIHVSLMKFHQGWQSTGQYAYWPGQWSLLVLTGHYWSIGGQLVDWKKLGWCEDTWHYLSPVLLNSIKTKSSLI